MQTEVGGAPDPAGLQVGATLFPLADAPFNGVTPQICDEVVVGGNACTVFRDIAEGESLVTVSGSGQLLIGTWSEGGSGGGVTTTAITADVRSGSGPTLDPIAADTTVNITQGVLLGTSQQSAP